MSGDPIGFRGKDTNLIRYVKNRIVNKIDVKGLSCTCGETITVVAAVGPFNAWSARNLATEALNEAATCGLPGLHNGAADAFRHCYWSCRMTQKIGITNAKKVGDIHEECGAGPPGETAMDLANNAVGRTIGATTHTATDCKTGCMAGVSSGLLQTSPGGIPPTNPYDPYEDYEDEDYEDEFEDVFEEDIY
ncbi:MAG: hypothetical protein LBF88_01340 [Planctomycetaceae bacterium]|jgi:hypothetical protein|nr:hypothetical protein [Planctomycetaceae bacterium]